MKLNLGACILFAPDLQMTANALAPFSDPLESPVALAPATGEDVRIHAYSIVSHA
jgi:hypothetical protein